MKKDVRGEVLRDARSEGTHHNPANSGQFFPYGGGAAICPGRVYARSEMLMAVAVAMLIFMFDIKMIGFVDGKGRPLAETVHGEGEQGDHEGRLRPESQASSTRT